RQSGAHRVEGRGEESPQYGRGRPSQKPPRVGKAWRYGLKAPRHERAEGSARQGPELGGGGLRTNGPTAGERAHSAAEVLRASKKPPGGGPPPGLCHAP